MLKLAAVYLLMMTSFLQSKCIASEMIQIPSGKIAAFWQSPVNAKEKNKKGVKKIAVNSFKMMKYPVTNAEYESFIRKNSQWDKKNVSGLYADESYLEMMSDKEIISRAPVTSVSWFAARAFCQSLGMRLPNVVEWEYVAAASELERDANKDEKFLKRILEWYGEPRTGSLKKVGSIYKNLYGVWDLHGLIWEWVEDFNTSFVTGESREDSSFNKDMFCGAGALSGADKENYAAFMRFAFRSGLSGKSAVWNLGFRCVEDDK